MRIKDRPGDFRVDELLREGVVLASGPHRVYRVIKRKHTSLEAARVLARLAEVPPSEVSLAGLKDRQGVTTQYMSVPRGRPVEHRSEGLTIRSEGFAREPIRAECSLGNAFRLKVRDVQPKERAALEGGLEAIARDGLPNYYDEQRFGNLRHGQGWIARDLALGHTEAALRALLAASSPHDDPKSRRFKEGVARAWGDWNECRRLAGRYGAHHSVFEHLRRDPDDFAGAFRHVSIRVRLIHLYALQSHLWNRAVAAFVAQRCGAAGAWCSDAIEGPLLFPAGDGGLGPDAPATFRLPGPRLEDVADAEQKALLADALAELGLVPDAFHVDGIAGFQLKGEDRELLVRPRALKWSFSDGPRDDDATASIAFELPRGAYASLVLRRLQARFVRGPVGPRDLRALGRPKDERGAREERTKPAGAGGRGRRWTSMNAPPPEARWSGGRAGERRGPKGGGPRGDRDARPGSEPGGARGRAGARRPESDRSAAPGRRGAARDGAAGSAAERREHGGGRPDEGRRRYDRRERDERRGQHDRSRPYERRGLDEQRGRDERQDRYERRGRDDRRGRSEGRGEDGGGDRGGRRGYGGQAGRGGHGSRGGHVGHGGAGGHGGRGSSGRSGGRGVGATRTGERRGGEGAARGLGDGGHDHGRGRGYGHGPRRGPGAGGARGGRRGGREGGSGRDGRSGGARRGER